VSKFVSQFDTGTGAFPISALGRMLLFPAPARFPRHGYLESDASVCKKVRVRVCVYVCVCACVCVCVRVSECTFWVCNSDSTCIHIYIKLQFIFRKRATNYRALLQKMTYKDKASCGSSPPCRFCCGCVARSCKNLACVCVCVCVCVGVHFEAVRMILHVYIYIVSAMDMWRQAVRHFSQKSH